MFYCRLHPLGLYNSRQRDTLDELVEWKRNECCCYRVRTQVFMTLISYVFTFFSPSPFFFRIWFDFLPFKFFLSFIWLVHVVFDGAALRLVSFTDCFVGSFAQLFLSFFLSLSYEFHFPLARRTLLGVHLSEIVFFHQWSLFFCRQNNSINIVLCCSVCLLFISNNGNTSRSWHITDQNFTTKL